jgi:hypothetical protein
MDALRTGQEGDKREGFMIPVPQYSLYAARMLEQNSYKVWVAGCLDSTWTLCMP